MNNNNFVGNKRINFNKEFYKIALNLLISINFSNFIADFMDVD